MKVRTRNFRKTSEDNNFWPAFTDVMSTVVLVLFFLILLAYVQQIILGSNFNNLKVQLKDTEQVLEERKLELTKREDALRILNDELETTKAEVEQGEKQLKLSAKMLEDQAKIIANSNEELGTLRAKLQDISLLRVDILRKVKESIEDQIGSSTLNGKDIVTIGDNANLIINESLLFDSGSATIKSNAKDLLDQFAVAFEKILDDESIRDSIDSINIEGHADDVGDSSYNRELSAKRASSVVDYLMQSNPALENKYGQYFAATGYSEFRPIDTSGTDAGRKKNRRIEISINIKDSHVQKIIEEYLNDAGKEFTN